MKTIEVSDDVWNALQRRAEPFVDEPDDVLRRLLEISATLSTSRNQKEGGMTRFPTFNNKTSAKEQGRRNRQKYVEVLQSKGIILEPLGKIFYRTSDGRRVAIPSATERNPGKWFLGMAESSFNSKGGLFVILLCVKEEQFLDFILPTETVSQILPQLSRDQHDQLKFNVAKRSNNHYELLLSGGSVLNITKFMHESSRLTA